MTHRLAEPIITRNLRVKPQSWSAGGACLRLEIFGCEDGEFLQHTLSLTSRDWIQWICKLPCKKSYSWNIIIVGRVDEIKMCHNSEAWFQRQVSVKGATWRGFRTVLVQTVLKADLHGTIFAYDCHMRFLWHALLASWKNRRRYLRYQIACRYDCRRVLKADLRPIYTVRFLLTIVACDFCSARYWRHGKIVYDFYDIKLPVATIVVGF